MSKPGAKSRSGKNLDRRALPDEAERLLRLIIKELQAPSDLQELLSEFPPLSTCSKEALAFIKAKDRAQRREAFIKNEALWYSKYGWFMARIVGLFGIIVFVSSFFLRGMGVDYVTAFILGAAGYYLLLVTLSNVKYRDTNKKRLRLLGKEAQKYQREIVPIAAALLKRFEVDPSRYPIDNPRYKAGLEETVDGLFIPVD